MADEANRRGFLGNVGLVAVGFLGLAKAAAAAPRTPAEEANVRVVNDFCAAWKTGDVAKIVSYFSDDIAFKNGGTPWMTGKPANTERIKGVFARYSSIEFEVVESWARGTIVMDERIDHLVQNGEKREFRLVGVFQVKNGKITEWADYGMD